MVAMIGYGAGLLLFWIVGAVACGVLVATLRSHAQPMRNALAGIGADGLGADHVTLSPIRVTWNPAPSRPTLVLIPAPSARRLPASSRSQSARIGTAQLTVMTTRPLTAAAAA